MEIGSSFNSGLHGFQQASGQITEEAININRQTLASERQPEQVAEQPVPQQPQSLESSIVNLSSELGNAQANAKTIETADEVLGSIIDIRV